MAKLGTGVFLAKKAKDLIAGNKEKVQSGIDKAADAADRTTKHQHRSTIDGIADKAKRAVGKLRK